MWSQMAVWSLSKLDILPKTGTRIKKVSLQASGDWPANLRLTGSQQGLDTVVTGAWNWPLACVLHPTE